MFSCILPCFVVIPLLCYMNKYYRFEYNLKRNSILWFFMFEWFIAGITILIEIVYKETVSYVGDIIDDEYGFFNYY